MALVDHCDHLPAGDGYHSLAVIGSAGAAYADDHQNMQLVFRGGHPQAIRTEEDDAAWLFLLLQEYVEVLQGGRADRFAGPLQWQNVWTTLAAVQHPCCRGRPFNWRNPDMPKATSFRCAVLSVLKHDYVARGLTAHARFELVVVADDPGLPDWAHERNQQFADAYHIPYVRDVERPARV